MNIEFINPFLEAGINVLETMAFVHPKSDKPFLKKTGEPQPGTISGFVQLKGPAMGSVVINFSTAAILHIVSSMFHEQLTEIDAEIAEAVGELSNIICGDARLRLAEKGYRFTASIPTVVTGQKHWIRHVVPGPSVVIPFTIDQVGSFVVDVCFNS